MLDRAGRVDEAIAWYRNAADTGDIFAPRQAARSPQGAPPALLDAELSRDSTPSKSADTYREDQEGPLE